MTKSLREEIEEYHRLHPPVKSPKACITCGKTIPYGSRCKQHGGSNWDTYGARYPERKRAYKDPTWRARREAQLAADPTCAVCRRPATDADHVLAVALGSSFDGPLQSLCRRCHLRKTAEDSKKAKVLKFRRRQHG